MFAIVFRAPEPFVICMPPQARAGTGGFGIATPDHGPQTANIQTKAPPVGPMPVGNVEESVARVEKAFDDSPTRDRRLATSLVQEFLAMPSVQHPTSNLTRTSYPLRGFTFGWSPVKLAISEPTERAFRPLGKDRKLSMRQCLKFAKISSPRSSVRRLLGRHANTKANILLALITPKLKICLLCKPSNDQSVWTAKRNISNTC